jgi:hypothetical protein
MNTNRYQKDSAICEIYPEIKMSVHVFFSLSSGLSAPLFVPKGTKQACVDHVLEVEKTLNIPRTKFKDNPEHWNTASDWNVKAIDDELLCETVTQHNQWVRTLYESFGQWSKAPVSDGEQLTPEDAQAFWFGLVILEAPLEKWTEDYYRNRMEHLYEVMRGRPSEGEYFDAEALSLRQAAEVIVLFSQFLDGGDIRSTFLTATITWHHPPTAATMVRAVRQGD